MLIERVLTKEYNPNEPQIKLTWRRRGPGEPPPIDKSQVKKNTNKNKEFLRKLQFSGREEGPAQEGTRARRQRELVDGDPASPC